MMGPGERARRLEAGGVLGPSLQPGVLGFVDGGTVKTAGRAAKTSASRIEFFCQGCMLGPLRT